MASIANRASGLVQRRTEAIRSAAAEKESGAEEDEVRRAEEEDDDKGDSKETRLTLMEEVLLLGLKDREVLAFSHPSTTLTRGRSGYQPLASAVFTLRRTPTTKFALFAGVRLYLVIGPVCSQHGLLVRRLCDV